MLDDWLRRPLLDPSRIRSRHDAVESLRDDVTTRERLHELLRDVYDLERLISRIARERADARDLRSLADTLSVVPELRDTLAGTDCPKLREIRESLAPLHDVRSLIEEAIQEDPDREITEGGLIRPSYDEKLAQWRETERDGKAWIDDLEKQEQKRTGIDSLTVGHNSVHGYYIEVTDANLDQVPADYERRQTLKNAERYYTPALKEREDEILRAVSLADEREYDLFCDVRSAVAAESERVQSLADSVAELDVLVSFATVAAEYDYTRPVVAAPERSEPAEDGSAPQIDGIHIEGGRHPVVERTESSFVPNDTHLHAAERLAILTGPNMSGKSTYMRQVALIVVLAQSGSFVPADAARLELVDRIFTRVGASDDIAGGRSTFMIEMNELSEILDSATRRSLVLLDEVGRGTSTTDGFAIARAVTEYLHDEIEPLTLFATHHHDLTAVVADLDRAYNLAFQTYHDDEGVVFEHTVERGTADASYGVEVAATAGVAESVVARARELLAAGPASRPHGHTDGIVAGADGGQMTPTAHRDSGVTDSTADEVRDRLREIDVGSTTPLEALNTLAELKDTLDEE
jgi:DNA mismatch repair protein MutS